MTFSITTGIGNVDLNSGITLITWPILGTDGDDVLRVFSGFPPAYYPDQTYQSRSMFGYGGNDTLIGGYGDDRLFGGDGDDTLFGNYGNDTLDGGDGTDTADFASYIVSGTGGGIFGVFYGNSWHPGYGVNVNLEFGTARSMDQVNPETDTLVSIENVNGTSYADILQGDEGSNVLNGREGDDWLYGWGGNDTLIGGDGTDLVVGGDGDDFLQGGFGTDYLYGGNDSDTVDYSYSSHGMSISLGGGAAYALDGSGIDSDSLNGIENANGSLGNDVISGSDDVNILQGLDGDDLLQGLGGDDYLFGGNGNDVLMGGAGGDNMDGSAGEDRVDYSTSSAGVTVRLDFNGGDGGDATGDTYNSIEDVTGSAFTDTLVGDGNDNRIDGGGGNDFLYGGDGDDVLTGGAGADTLFGQNGSDTASYAASSAGVTINLAAHTAAGGDAAGDALLLIENLEGSAFADRLTGDANDNVLSGLAGNDTLAGGQGNDTLLGGLGVDHLNGGAGNDVLTGGAGADVLTGGAGDDSFDFTAFSDTGLGAARDRITDFQQGHDHIDLSALGAFTFIGETGFSGAGDEVSSHIVGGNTLVEIDTGGAPGAEMQILLTGAVHLTTGDFIL
ncbi:hypothetical protein [Aestuariivirga sp.]|uniref:calcium-binding protein n=1 Tax=Aestuariivirga sp. TaxID=2650926 RepID=UPI0039E6AD33